jgi:hypothetical protein
MTTTKYALKGTATSARVFLSDRDGCYSMNIEEAVLFDSLERAAGSIANWKIHMVVPVAVDITETEGTLTELPTLQEGPGIVFRVRFDYGVKGFITDPCDDVQGALNAYRSYVRENESESERIYGPVRLVALKRTEPTKTYTVRELR